MNDKDITKLQNRIEKIKQKILNIGDIKPGSISEQYNVCGTPGCSCKNKKDPKKHGPYYYLSYTFNGNSVTEFVKKEDLRVIRKSLDNYRSLKSLTNQWVELSIRISRLKKS